MKGSKIFLDTVHGYISVPNEYCDKFVDTANFQRLRRIEQLSSRSLYPCARHDRFVHSIGVFHIGERLLDTIKCDGVELDETLKQSFLIACLLHDVGHSPFSHTLESLFGSTSDLFNVYKSNLVENGIEDQSLQALDVTKTDVKQHEIMSALLCVTMYKEAILSLNGDPALVGRMIMGFQYNDDIKSLENSFITLLHGDVIDADKLDYICRDKWSSGYQNNSVDVERIIKSVKLHRNKEGKYSIVYLKNALYDIQSMMDNKNFQNNWVFKHHQVIYEQKIFKDAVEELVKCLGKDVKKEQLFNYRSFFEKTEVCDGIFVYMLSDDDIIHLMKSHHENIPHFSEWFSRSYEYVPIWKTYSELIAILGSDLSDYLLNDVGEVYDKIEDFLRNEYNVKVFTLESTPLMKSVEKGKVYLMYEDDLIVDYTDLGMPKADTTYKNKTFKYVFVEKTLFENTEINRKDIVLKIVDFLNEIKRLH